MPRYDAREPRLPTSGGHRLMVFGAFLLLLTLLTSLPSTSRCRGPVCPPHGTSRETPDLGAE